MYNENNETIKHIIKVAENMGEIIDLLVKRSINHDRSKLSSYEAPYFEEYTPKLKETTYGSEEYRIMLEELKPALDHHYANNRHHPQYFKNGINDMNLIDFLELICDWYASCSRHDDGDIIKSIEISQKRFNYSDDIKNLLLNTVLYLNWR